MKDLSKQFEEQTGTPAINSQGEPDIDYVAWLESRVLSLNGLIEEAASCVGVAEKALKDIAAGDHAFPEACARRALAKMHEIV